MAKLEVEELKKIVSMSSFRLTDQEVEDFVSQIKTLLDYIQELSDVELASGVDKARNINVFRDDKTVIYDSTPLLDQAPQREDSYFVVPKVL